jgi:protein SMG6
LKKLYRALSNLETKIKQEESFVRSSMEDGMNGAVMLGGKEKDLVIKGKTTADPGEVERERWKRIINNHKEYVSTISSLFFGEFTPLSNRIAEIGHNLLEISLSPSVPASLPSTTSLSACGPTVSTNSSKLFAALPSAPHLP